MVDNDHLFVARSRTWAWDQVTAVGALVNGQTWRWTVALGDLGLTPGRTMTVLFAGSAQDNAGDTYGHALAVGDC
jgi:hypothetical protein